MSRQYGNGFDMGRMRKHVDGLKRTDGISVPGDRRQIAGERLRVAGDVDRAARQKLPEHRADHRRGAALARRVENDGVPRAPLAAGPGPTVASGGSRTMPAVRRTIRPAPAAGRPQRAGLNRGLHTARHESAPLRRNPIQPQARLAVGHRRPVLLHGHHVAAGARERQREQPDARTGRARLGPLVQAASLLPPPPG